jgi:hypothetical protein
VDTFDERVLRDDKARLELGGVVPDLPGQPSALQLGQ